MAFSTLADALEQPPVTCAHVTGSGLRCLRPPAEHDTVCVLHGASVVHASEVIQRKLLALQEKSIAVAEELLMYADDRVRATVMTAIWDRTGLGPKSTVAIEQSADLSALSTAELAAELDRLSQMARQEAEREQPLMVRCDSTVQH